MSDAKGDDNDPTTGEPIEAADRPDDGAAEARLPQEPAAHTPDDDQRQGAAADATAPDATAEPANGQAPGAEQTLSGQTPDDADAAPAERSEGSDADHSADPAASTAPDTAVYDLDDDAPSGDAATKPTASGADAPVGGASTTDPAPTSEDTEAIGSEGADEPDYAALAAELEEFEARQGGAAGAAPPAHTAPTAVGSGWFEEAPETFKATEPDDAPTEVVDPVEGAKPAVVPNEPAAYAAPAPEAVITESYEPPRKRGNRVAALLIGVPATIAFTILYALVDLAYGWFQNEVAPESLVADLLERIAEPAFWVPVVVFFLAFWLVGVIVNRASAGWWVVFGFLVAAVSYAGFVVAPVLTYPFWMITPGAANEQMQSLLLNPVAIGVFIIAREVTVWFGAWVAGRGRKMKRLNADDRAEYEKAIAEDE
ncbi:MFS transporter [Microbacterium halotolerans]|uniref:MFS transporter n=1 Tax=Microbacterium halotolerans TaxID=246613 RepID=UPI000E6A98ED|nr:MFS transporter [Microbacterium halotolerans]